MIRESGWLAGITSTFSEPTLDPGIVKTEVVNTWVDDIRAVHSGVIRFILFSFRFCWHALLYTGVYRSSKCEQGLLMFQRRIFSDEAALEYLNVLKKLDYQSAGLRTTVYPRGDEA